MTLHLVLVKPNWIKLIGEVIAGQLRTVEVTDPDGYVLFFGRPRER
jgi:hypothetical protein